MVKLVKIGHSLWTWFKLVHFCIIWGSKCRHMSKFWESSPIILSLQVSKNYFRFMDLNVVKNAINWVNLVKIGHFWWKWSKLGHFGIIWGLKCHHMTKFWEIGPIILSLKVSKNYLSQVYGQKCGKMSLMGSIWSKLVIFGENGQNWVILA